MIFPAVILPPFIHSPWFGGKRWEEKETEMNVGMHLVGGSHLPPLSKCNEKGRIIGRREGDGDMHACGRAGAWGKPSRQTDRQEQSCQTTD
jgi:hypothetical protein